MIAYGECFWNKIINIDELHKHFSGAILRYYIFFDLVSSRAIWLGNIVNTLKLSIVKGFQMQLMIKIAKFTVYEYYD